MDKVAAEAMVATRLLSFFSGSKKIIRAGFQVNRKSLDFLALCITPHAVKLHSFSCLI